MIASNKLAYTETHLYLFFNLSCLLDGNFCFISLKRLLILNYFFFKNQKLYKLVDVNYQKVAKFGSAKTLLQIFKYFYKRNIVPIVLKNIKY